MAKPELIIFTKAYDFTLWAMQHTEKFPRSARFSVSVRIENELLNLLTDILTANHRRKKIAFLVKIDNDLEKLRILIRLSKDMKFININSYEYAARCLDELGRL